MREPPETRTTVAADFASETVACDYVAVGHVTRDVIEDTGAEQPGGSALYGALQAARLGLRAAIVTQGVPAQVEAMLEPYKEELAVHTIPAERTTTLATRGKGERRRQRMLAWAGPMEELPPIDAAILHLAPVARELQAPLIPATASAGEHAATIPRGNTKPVPGGAPARTARAPFVGITPQGLVRAWAEGEGASLLSLDASSMLGDVPIAPGTAEPVAGEIAAVELDPALLPERFDAAVISEHECPSCKALFAAARERGASVAVTAGSRPATLHLPPAFGGHVVQAPVCEPVAVRDDLGAGDVFAAAFFVALYEGREPLRAAAFANAAAAVRVAGTGPNAIGERTRIEAAMRAHPAMSSD